MPKYIYPPRPKGTIHPGLLPNYDNGNWLAQLKFDGDRCVAVIDKKVCLSNRHGKFHPDRNLPVLKRELSDLNLPIGTYLDGELLHPAVDQTLVLFDVLQLGQEYLFGEEQARRLDLLKDICKTPTSEVDGGIAYQVSPHIWMARCWNGGFADLFKWFTPHELIEGLVLRKVGSIIDNWGASEYEVDWQIRCRKPSKKYRY